MKISDGLSKFFNYNPEIGIMLFMLIVIAMAGFATSYEKTLDYHLKAKVIDCVTKTGKLDLCKQLADIK